MTEKKNISSSIEEQIVLLLQSQDKRAITLIFAHYKVVLLGVITKIVRDEDLAEDILQDSLVKMWKYGSKYDPKKGRLFTWLLQICRNTAIDKTRLKSFQATQKIQNPSEPVSMKLPNETYEQKIDVIGLDNLVEQLDPKYKQLLDLVYFQGYTQQEIAKEFDIPLGTVKTRVRSAIKQLRLWLKA